MGVPIGKHAAIADKIAHMAANTFAMEAMTLLRQAMWIVTTCGHPARSGDVQVVGTERAWEIVNETMQIRGGRGYETAIH